MTDSPCRKRKLADSFIPFGLGSGAAAVVNRLDYNPKVTGLPLLLQSFRWDF